VILIHTSCGIKYASFGGIELCRTKLHMDVTASK
jgi:hypothetical protein